MNEFTKMFTEDSRSFTKSYNDQRYDRLVETIDEYLGCEGDG